MQTAIQSVTDNDNEEECVFSMLIRPSYSAASKQLKHALDAIIVITIIRNAFR